VLLLLISGCSTQSRMSYYNRYWSEAVVFEVSVDESLLGQVPSDGRLYTILRPLGADDESPGVPSPDLVFAEELEGWDWQFRATVGEQAIGYPVGSLAEIENGRYMVQPVLCSDESFSHFNEPGCWFGLGVELELATGYGLPVHRLTLVGQVAAEPDPIDTDLVRHLQVGSRLLSEHRGRPVELEAAVVLPRGYEQELERRYPVRYHIGPHEGRARDAVELMAEGSEFRQAWMADDTPRMILVVLDGRAGRYVDSEVDGPVATAVVTELIPAVESRFRVMEGPGARFLDAASEAGGWSALALQVFFPELFNGVWSACSDSVDFRALGLIDIYEDENVFVNQWGVERPSSRESDGEPVATVGMDVWQEQVLGRDGDFRRSGGRWASRHAAFSPAGDDGLPRPLWDPETGAIDREVADAWGRYDLRRVVVERWPEIGEHLAGKLHLWMGSMNSMYNNRAVHLLAEALSALDEPPAGARIVFGPGQPYCWHPVTDAELMEQMLSRVPR
jgi:hypothetical protein